MTLKTAFTAFLLSLFNFFQAQKSEFKTPDCASIQQNLQDEKILILLSRNF